MKSPLMPFDDALAALLARAAPVSGVERVATLEADGRVLAEPQRSTMNVPAADNTQMDGYAVRCADLVARGAGEGGPAADGQAGGATEPALRLRVAQKILAGHPGSPLEPGTAARIFTGANIPEGADAVVMQEQAQADGDHVVILHRPQPGEWIRRTGEDIREGGVILEEGARLTPQATGLAASIGLASLPVRRRVRVACFFTGDELVMPGEPLPPGAIYNSNRFFLGTLLRRLGCEVTDLGIVPDSLEATRAALREAATGHDLVLTSGGVSVGEADHVKPAVQAEGSLDLWQIAIKPGKPLAYGRVRRAAGAGAKGAAVRGSAAAEGPATEDQDFAHFIGLPGNPVSSFVTFLLLVRPFVLRLQGARDTAPQAFPMRADFDWPRPDKRREFLRVRVNAQGGLELFPNQGSAVLTSTVWADGLVDNPAGQRIARGDVVRFLPMAGLLG
ncbi:MAG TPA: gephyrin-like molybdotransferase Glp [Quisquiliibacterium sp.]|nr:gephyrin-like molybdotransferase Glp [Quisquiliibacterium sp.]